MLYGSLGGHYTPVCHLVLAIRRTALRRLLVLTVGLAILVGCAPSSPAGPESPPRPPPRTNSLTIGVTTQLTQMGVFAGQSTGGWTTLIELHSAGLITSDVSAPHPI